MRVSHVHVCRVCVCVREREERARSEEEAKERAKEGVKEGGREGKRGTRHTPQPTIATLLRLLRLRLGIRSELANL
jgi:hypothetical protein